MILLYLLLAVLAVISVLLLICLVRACIHKKSVPQTPLVRRENPDAMRIAGQAFQNGTGQYCSPARRGQSPSV